jgi:hypothetical protein
MTDDSYREDDEKEELVKKKKKKSEKKDDEKKKSVAFKATTSKGKSKIESSSDEDSSSCNLSGREGFGFSLPPAELASADSALFGKVKCLFATASEVGKETEANGGHCGDRTLH